MKRRSFLLIVLLICLVFSACGKSTNAIQCEELIAELGTISLNSEEKLTEAEEAYNALSDGEKQQISEAGQVLADAREKYDELFAKETEKANAVIAKIGEIGSVTLGSEGKINEARQAYTSLTTQGKRLVTNFDVLVAAENRLNELKEQEKARVLSEAKVNFVIEEDKVEGVTWYTHKSTPQYIDIRSYISPYIGVRDTGAWICIRYNYTGDDWIFWEKLTIVIDGERITKNFRYSDIHRDNDYPSVWEYYDEALGWNEKLTSKDLTMLSKIANSNETIIRFEGDDHVYDLVVTAQDKAVIRDVLALYGAMVG